MERQANYCLGSGYCRRTAGMLCVLRHNMRGHTVQQTLPCMDQHYALSSCACIIGEQGAAVCWPDGALLSHPVMCRFTLAHSCCALTGRLVCQALCVLADLCLAANTRLHLF
eukprot:1148842-Pelagomonas_calceolata.AAC.4